MFYIYELSINFKKKPTKFKPLIEVILKSDNTTLPLVVPRKVKQYFDEQATRLVAPWKGTSGGLKIRILHSC